MPKNTIIMYLCNFVCVFDQEMKGGACGLGLLDLVSKLSIWIRSNNFIGVFVSDWISARVIAQSILWIYIKIV